MNTDSLKNCLPSDKPYEKFDAYGPESLTDTELLAILLRSGTKGKDALFVAASVLTLCPYEEGLSGLFHLTVPELLKVDGIGKVKAVQLKCVAELASRLLKAGSLKKETVTGPDSAAQYFMERLRHLEVECIYCVMLDTKNRITGSECVSKGTVNASLISPREVFKKALSYNAVSIVLIHNHPSGDPSPSGEDFAVTKRMVEAGSLLGIRLLDHIIIGNRTYYSFSREGSL